MDNICDSPGSVAAWIDDRLHDGWSHSYPTCHRHRCGAGPGYKGAKTGLTISSLAGKGELFEGMSKTDGRQNMSITKVIINDKRKAYEEKFDAQLKEWNAQISLLRAKADNARADAKIDYYKTIDAFEHKEKEARTKLQELKTAGDEAWEAVKAGMEKIWAEVKEAYQEGASTYK